MSVSWDYFDRFEEVVRKYMPARGEGETMASQIVTAVNKLVYKWYNDGDVFDNTHWMSGWCNDLSSYANWLFKYVPQSAEVLDGIVDCENDDDYEELLKDLADMCLNEQWLKEMWAKCEKSGSIYDCDGPYVFEEPHDDEEDDDDEWDDDEDEEDDEEW